jgi:RNA polymerase sigma factor (sigma-70 family)
MTITKYPRLTREQEQAAVIAGDTDLLARSQIPWCRLLVKGICRRWRFRDSETALAGGLYGLAIAIHHYDGRVRLSTFCRQWIQRLTIREIELAGRQVAGVQADRRAKGIEVGSLGFDPVADQDPARHVDNRDTVNRINSVVDLLPRDWQLVFRSRLAGKSIRQVVADTGISEHNVKQIYSETLTQVIEATDA